MLTPVVVVMGVSGAGKSTIAEALAARLGFDEVDGDSLHPAANIAKMAAGQPLDDADRLPWLHLVRDWIVSQQAAGRPGIVTCSALKRSYRDLLRGDGVSFVLLAVDRATLASRLRERVGHFVGPELLDSQLAAFEPPVPDEHVHVVDAGRALDAVVADVVAAVHAAAWQAE